MRNLSINSKKIISYVEKGIAMVLCVTTLGAFASCSGECNEKESTNTIVQTQVDKNQNTSQSGGSQADKNQKNLIDSKKRSEEIRNAEDPNIKFIETYNILSKPKNFEDEKLYIVSLKENDGTVGLFNYDTLTEEIPCGKYNYISTSFTCNGQTYRQVRVPGDEDYIPGWLNMETFKEDIPCNKYISISFEEFEFTYNGQTYRNVRVPGDDDYMPGWLNMETFKEDIPCKTYDNISYRENEFIYNGVIYRYVSVPDDSKYEYGWLNMETFEEEIPCKTYVDSEVVTIDDVDYYTFKDTKGNEKTYSFKK